MFSDLSQIIAQIASHFHVLPHQVGLTPIRHGMLERNNVWRLTITEHPYLLKQHLIARPVGESVFTPFHVESLVLSTLYQADCPVPNIHWQSESSLCLLLAWGGDITLDDLAQETPPEDLKPTIRKVIQALCQLEDRFARSAHAIKPYVYPLHYPDFLHRGTRELLDRGRKMMNYLAWLTGQPMSAKQQAAINEIWGRMSNRLYNAVPTLGRLDYNARNVVVDGDAPTFIDFGSVGWDWGQRRLVQSLNSLGANRFGGNFICLLNQVIVREYSDHIAKLQAVPISDREEIAAQVDYHNLLFYLSIVYRLVQATAQREAPENRSLLKAWGNAKARFQRAVDLLVDSRLSDDPDARQIREFVGEFRDASEQKS